MLWGDCIWQPILVQVVQEGDHNLLGGTVFGSQFWSGGLILAATFGLGGPLLGGTGFRVTDLTLTEPSVSLELVAVKLGLGLRS